MHNRHTGDLRADLSPHHRNLAYTTKKKLFCSRFCSKYNEFRSKIFPQLIEQLIFQSEDSAHDTVRLSKVEKLKVEKA